MGKLTLEEIEKLFMENIFEINKMNIASGSLIKQIILELEKQKTFIRLKNAAPNGHSIEYEFLEGIKELIYALAEYLGFYLVTDNKLEVINA